jgi:hypothetical protein
MKKFGFILFVIAFAFRLECSGQKKQIVYGTVRSDGYQKISKGAFWGVRPEAKLIYEGEHPDGYTVIVLEEDFFVRFVDGEHNQNDKNYIVFPKGEIVYTNNKTGRFYSAKCGNEIEYKGRVDFTEILPEKQPEVIISQIQNQTTDQGIVLDYGGEKKKDNQPHVNTTISDLKPEKVKKKFFHRKGVKVGCFVIGAGGLGGIIYAILHKGHSAPHGTMSNGRPYTTTPDTAPVTPGDGSGGRGS